MWNDIVIARARAFMIAAHEAVGQKRKYTGEPYWTHPQAVAELVARYEAEATGSMIVAALLHDVVEDTRVPIEIIEQEFGPLVCSMVRALTKEAVEGNRAFRMAHECRRLSLATPQVKTIKLADLVDNTRSIVDRDPKFARVYMAEKRDLLPALKAGNAALWEIASTTVEAYFTV